MSATIEEFNSVSQCNTWLRDTLSTDTVMSRHSQYRVTRKVVANTFGIQPHAVRQICSMQLFIIDIPAGRVLVSYKTIVGRFIDNAWRITTQFYSITTSQQINRFISQTEFDVIRVSTL